MKYYLLLIITGISNIIYNQELINIQLISNKIMIEDAKIYNIKNDEIGKTNSEGEVFIPTNKIVDSTIIIIHPEYIRFDKKIGLTTEKIILELIPKFKDLEEVVISGNLKQINKLNSVTPVESYNISFLNRTPSCNIFESIQNVNGVRPQLNCAICNTGDIHINGLEGPYTMVLIDGVPIVSNLSTVYGLSGIPNSLIERIEVIKGPASTLYGSEAIGGIINIITKNEKNSPKISIDVLSTNQLENNLDIGFKSRIKKNTILTGINFYHFNNPFDLNKDNFTDIALSQRVSIFQKWNIPIKNENLSIAGRYYYEDRWGGEMDWNKMYRGTDLKYGESIYTSRIELFGGYKLPIKKNIQLTFSYNNHIQDSYYGTTKFYANQSIAFGQIVNYKSIKKHDFLTGLAQKSLIYDDNTPATENYNEIQNTTSLFFQDEFHLSKKNTLLIGSRLDYNSIHKLIFTPRIGIKLNIKNDHIIRINSGSGFRNVNVFTEDHAALTGAKEVIIASNLKPEKSYNINLNYYKPFYLKNNQKLIIDASVFYTYFTNRIIPDYSVFDKIIYENINGYHINKGFSFNINYNKSELIKMNAGITLIDNKTFENNTFFRPLLTEKFNATWGIEYLIKNIKTEIVYSGFIVGSMILPLVNEFDPRPSHSPLWSNHSIVIKNNSIKNFELFLGVKNIFNYTPNKSTKMLIARPHDPFDKNVQYDQQGNILQTSENPYGLTFDPSYIFAPNQGTRFIFGLNYQLK